MVTSEPKPRPMLRWAGSKKKLLPRLVQYWKPSHKRYIEPFCGSACLYFEISPTKAILGDSNDELISFYKTIRRRPEEVYTHLVQLRRDKSTYEAWRSMDVNKLDRIARAVRFLYLNRNCFNGIYRTNQTGKFNVPFGSKLGPHLELEAVKAASDRLKSARLIAGDFMATIGHAERGDFVYLDPPYAAQSSRIFSEYGKRPFSVFDLGRLSQSLRELNSRGCTFLLSYASCPEIESIRSEWISEEVLVTRNVAGFTKSRRQAKEVLVTNLNCMKGMVE